MSDQKIQEKDSDFAAYCLYSFYPIKILKTDVKSAVLLW